MKVEQKGELVVGISGTSRASTDEGVGGWQAGLDVDWFLLGWFALCVFPKPPPRKVLVLLSSKINPSMRPCLARYVGSRRWEPMPASDAGEAVGSR